MEPHHLRRGARADRGAPGRRPPRLPGVGVARGDRAAAGRAAGRRRRHLPAGRGRRRAAATPARWPSTPTAPKAEAMRELAERDRHRPRRRPPPTPTRPPTCRCSRRWATRWRSTPTGRWPGRPASAAGRSGSSPSRCGCATGSPSPAGGHHQPGPGRRRVLLLWRWSPRGTGRPPRPTAGRPDGPGPASPAARRAGRRAAAGVRRAAQVVRSRLAATTPRVMRMARISSFFMGEPTRSRPRTASVPGPVRPRAGRRPAGQTVSRSRAPVSEEGWRSLDMARASIWRIRSRVRLKCSPTSSRVRGSPRSRPKRRRRISRSRSSSGESSRPISSGSRDDGGHLEGRLGRAVLDHVAELGVAVLAQRLGERQRLGPEAQRLDQLVLGHLHLDAQLGQRGRAAELELEAGLGLLHPGQRVAGVDRAAGWSGRCWRCPG